VKPARESEYYKYQRLTSNDWFNSHVTILAIVQLTAISCYDRHFISMNNLSQNKEFCSSAPVSETLTPKHNVTALTNPKIFSKFFNHRVKVNNL
jgi:hypothetical protein